MARKAKTPGIISSLLSLTTPRKLAKRIGIKPTQLKKIEQGEVKPTKSEISKISHLNKLIPAEEQQKNNIKRAKMLDVPREEVKDGRRAKTLKEIEKFNTTVARREYKYSLTQKTLDYDDIRRLTGISKYELEKRLHRARINADTLHYTLDGMIVAKDALGIPKVLVREQWTDGRFPAIYVFMRQDILDAYIEYRKKGFGIMPGSDIWNDPTYQLIYKFGVYQALAS